MPEDHADPVAALRACTARPFEEARAMPPAVYTSESFLKAELKHIFAKDWYCVGRASALAAPGDYVTCELAGQPIVVLRGRDRTLRAMSNVCLHRMSTLLEGRGNTRAIVCPYHAWTYNLDGTLRGAPAMSLNDGFSKSDYCLPSVRCEVWLGWVFVTLDPAAAPVAQGLGALETMIERYRMEDYTESFREEHLWDTNWKVLAENFMESYHLPVCHADTIGGLSKLEEMVCPPGHPAFNFHTILKNDALRIALAHPSNDRLVGDERRMTWLMAIYPSLLVTLTPGYFWYLSLLPKAPGKVQILFGGGMSNDFLGDPDAEEVFGELKALLDEVNEEDRGCTEKVYRGLCAPLSAPGHLSHLERPNYEFAQYIMRRIGEGGAAG
ncbi:Rieske 2Fe-2S domain-containing protein [Sulfitobacter sp. LCG007]